MASRKLLVLMAGFVVAVATPPTAAYAGIKCKGASVTGLGGSSGAAVSTWVNHVRRAYGSGWSNYSLARNKRSTYQFLPPAEGIYSVTATPCMRA
jgi:hypothetical protein